MATRKVDEQEVINRRREDPLTAWERHGQSITAAIVLLILSWVGINVNDNAKGSAVMRSQIDELQKKVDILQLSINTDMQDRYRGTDAQRDFAAVYKEIERIKNDDFEFMKHQAAAVPRVKSLEARIVKLEQIVDRIDKEHDANKKQN